MCGGRARALSKTNESKEWPEKIFLILGIGGLAGLSWLEEPFGVFEVVLKLFGGSLYVGVTAIVLLSVFGGLSDDRIPSWKAIFVNITIAYAVASFVMSR